MPTQLTLSLEPALLDRYRNLRDCIAAGVYQRGLKRVAADIDMAPGNLSVALGDDGTRHLSVDALERYLQTSGDLTPIHYLVARYLGHQAAGEEAALARVEQLLSEVSALLPKKARR